MTLTQYLQVSWLVIGYALLTAAVIALAVRSYREEEEIVESSELIDLTAVTWEFNLQKESEPASLPAQYKITHRPQRRVK